MCFMTLLAKNSEHFHLNLESNFVAKVFHVQPIY